MHCIRRSLTALATLAGALLAFTAGAPAAFASRMPPPEQTAGPAQPPPQLHTVVVGGMPGWQITLISAAAALAAAVVAVLLDRAWAARKTHATTAGARRPYPAGPPAGQTAARPGHRYPG